MRVEEDGNIAMGDGDYNASEVVATGSLKYLGDYDGSMLLRRLSG